VLVSRLALPALAGAALLLSSPAAASAAGRDGNHDRLPDSWERAHHLSLQVNQARRDQDRDGLRNLAEYRLRLDPRDPDTDDDGIRDGREDTDGDGVPNAQDRVPPAVIPRPAESHEGAPLPADVVHGPISSYEPATHALKVGDLTAEVTPGTVVQCATPSGDGGPGRVVACTAAALVPGRFVLWGQHRLDGGREIWTRVVVLVIPEGSQPPPPPAPVEPPPTTPVLGTFVSLADGTLTLRRENSEDVSATVAGADLKCAPPAPVGTEPAWQPCSTDDLPNATRIYGLRVVTDGHAHWTLLRAVVPSS
jgi:hypothetical protein